MEPFFPVDLITLVQKLYGGKAWGGGSDVNKKGAVGSILTDLPDWFQKNWEEF